MNAFNKQQRARAPAPSHVYDKPRLVDLSTAASSTQDPSRSPSPPSSTGQIATVDQIARLHAALDLVSADVNPRTAQLLTEGRRRMGQKLIEEASEVAFEGLRDRARGVIRESADLLYHLVVLWRECGVSPDEVWREMSDRADTLGIAEKLPKRRNAQV